MRRPIQPPKSIWRRLIVSVSILLSGLIFLYMQPQPANSRQAADNTKTNESAGVTADQQKSDPTDLEITRRVSEAVGVPVVASGGAGNLQHMADVLKMGKADAVLAASIFHFGEFTVAEVKRFLAEQDISIRL